MSKPLRTITIFLIFVVLIGVVRAPFETFDEDLVQRLIDVAKKNNVLLKVEGYSLRFPVSMEIDSLSGYVATPNAFPIPFLFTDTSLSPRFLPLLWLSGEVEATSTGYGGGVSLKVSHPLMGNSANVKLTGTQLQLGKHPTLKPYGINGELSFSLVGSIDGLDKAQPQLQTGLIEVTVKKGQFPSGYKINNLIPIPAASNIEMNLVVEAKNQKSNLKKARLTSSLGSATGSGSLELNKKGLVKQLDLSFEISLSQQGVESLGGYLALAAGEPVDSKINDWLIVVSQTGTKRPVATVTAR